MSDGRTTILARVREALSIPTDTKFLHFRQHDGAAPADPRSFMPPCGDNAKDRIELFRLNSEQLRTEFHVCPDLEMAAVLVRGLAAKEGWKKVGAHRHPMVDALVAGAGVPVLLTDDGYATPDLESCSVGITACEALNAQTGSVLVTSRSSGGTSRRPTSARDCGKPSGLASKPARNCRSRAKNSSSINESASSTNNTIGLGHVNAQA